MGWIWTLIVGAIIGAVAGAITNNGHSMGWIANIVAGLAGSALGQALFGNWGWHLGGMAVIPALLGAIIVVAIVAFIMTKVFNKA